VHLSARILAYAEASTKEKRNALDQGPGKNLGKRKSPTNRKRQSRKVSRKTSSVVKKWRGLNPTQIVNFMERKELNKRGKGTKGAGV